MCSKPQISRYVSADVVNLTNLISAQYTVNGKKIEIAVKQIVSGSNLKPSGTVANPESLNLYYKYRDIEGLTGEKTKAKL
jgi:acetoacetyl-CoA synthetase